MARLKRHRELVGTDFKTPGVGCDGGDLGRVDPFQGFKRHAGGVAARVVAPAGFEAGVELACANEDDVAFANLACGPLFCDGFEDVVALDCEAIGKDALDAVNFLSKDAADVQQDTAGTDVVLEDFDPRRVVAKGIDRVSGRNPVVSDAVVKAVAETIPLSCALERHDDAVVCKADTVGERAEESLWVDVVAAVKVHDVKRVGPSVQAVLRTVGIELQAARDGFASLDALGRFDALGAIDVVDCAWEPEK